MTGTGDRDLVLRRIRALSDNSLRVGAMTVDFTCRESIKSHVLIIRARGRSALPVTVRGKVVATTDAAGIAQVVISGAPEEQVDVAIDTSDMAGLQPQMPARRFTLPTTRRFLVFDQNFEERRRPARIARKRREVSGPTRL